MSEDLENGKNEFSLLHVDELPGAVIVTDNKHVIMAINGSASDLLEYSREEVVGWPLEKLFPDRPRGIDLLIGRGAGAVELEMKARPRSAKPILVNFLASPIVRDGDVVAVVYLVRDIRVHRLVDEDVKRSRDYFKSVINRAPVGLCITDLKRQIVFMNTEAEKLIGRNSRDLIGKNVSAFYPKDFDLSETDIKKLVEGDLSVRENDFVREDGSVVPVQLAYSYVPERGGEGPYIVESYSDQTDRRRLDRLKNEFVFIAAHELRSPVSAINLLLNLIFEDNRIRIDPIMRDYLNKLLEAEGRLLQLVDDLLEVSRTEVGRLKIESGPQDIAGIVKSVCGDLRANSLSRGVQLVCDETESVPRVMADEAKLHEVLVNLISNSIKYNVPGGSVTVAHEVKDGRLITTVTDTGIGIKESDQGRLFQKFWRSDDLSVRSQPGTGLGLFIVKELVERMGGDVTLESKEGKGTTVVFSLPLAPPEMSRGVGSSMCEG